MPWTAAAIVAGAGITAWAGSEGSKKASEAQMGASRQGNVLTRDMFNQIRGDLMPFVGGGTDAMGSLKDLMGLGGKTPDQIQAILEKLPGYQFVKQQGMNAVQNRFGAMGQALSGPGMRGIADYVTGLADSTYGNQVNRLMGLTELGENAAAQTGSFGTAASSQMNQNLLFGGNAQAAGILGQYNALGSFGGQLSQMGMLNSLMRNQGYTGLFGQSAPKKEG